MFFDTEDITDRHREQLEYYLKWAVPQYVEENTQYFFPSPDDCLFFIVNRVLLLEEEYLLAIFMNERTRPNPETSVPGHVLYTELLRFARYHNINTRTLPKRQGIINTLETIGYEIVRPQTGEIVVFGMEIKPREF